MRFSGCPSNLTHSAAHHSPKTISRFTFHIQHIQIHLSIQTKTTFQLRKLITMPSQNWKGSLDGFLFIRRCVAKMDGLLWLSCYLVIYLDDTSTMPWISFTVFIFSGNELSLSLHSSSCNQKEEKNTSFGFKCQISGFPGSSETDKVK